MNSRVMMSDVCTSDFFSELGSLVGGDAGQYISDNKDSFADEIIVNYNMGCEAIFKDNLDMAVRMVHNRCSLSITRVYDAIIKEYNPITNASLTETLEHSGNDTTSKSNTEGTQYGGEDALSHEGTDGRTVNGNSNATSNETETVTTYDGSTSEPIHSTNFSGQNSGESTESMTYGRVEVSTYGKTKEFNSEGELIVNYNNTLTKTREGNIGIVSFPKLIEDEELFRYRRTFTQFVIACVINVISTGVWYD